ncbi:MAG TPA: hypothetical protein EYP71_05630 [Dehalococcoidia bacterium]|nr:hypothetical protein [Dehalococcoidia bacterium]
MSLIRGIVTGIGLIGVLVIVALLIGYYLFSLSPPVESRMTKVLPSPEAAQSFDQKLETLKAEIDAAISANEERELTLTITEKEANSKLTQLRAKGELPSKEMWINFGNGYFLIYAVIDVPGVDAKTATMGRIEIVDDNPKVIIQEFNLGKLPLPKSIDRRVEQLLNIMIRLQLADMPLDITGVQIKNHQLTVTGITRTT